MREIIYIDDICGQILFLVVPHGLQECKTAKNITCKNAMWYRYFYIMSCLEIIILFENLKLA